MKITEKYLRQVIEEELDGVMEASDIPDRQKAASDVTSEMALIAKLRTALQGRDEVKPNEYDTLWVAIGVVLDVLENANVDTAAASPVLRRGLEMLINSIPAPVGDHDAREIPNIKDQLAAYAADQVGAPTDAENKE